MLANIAVLIMRFPLLYCLLLDNQLLQKHGPETIVLCFPQLLLRTRNSRLAVVPSVFLDRMLASAVAFHLAVSRKL